MRFSSRRRVVAGLALAAALVCAGARADDLGVIGPVYTISEVDLLQFIQESLRRKEASGELARLQEEAKRRAVAGIEDPPAIEGLAATRSPRTYYFDPTVSFAENITDDKGNLIVAAGTRSNPLDTITLSKRLLFFDARDARQVERAREVIDAHGGKVKPILVAGSYLDLMRRWQAPVYYDQRGSLVSRFGIRQVPALVSQEGKRLRIDELAL